MADKSIIASAGIAGSGAVSKMPTVRLRWRDGVLEQQWQIHNHGGIPAIEVEWRPIPVCNSQPGGH